MDGGFFWGSSEFRHTFLQIYNFADLLYKVYKEKHALLIWMKKRERQRKIATWMGIFLWREIRRKNGLEKTRQMVSPQH